MCSCYLYGITDCLDNKAVGQRGIIGKEINQYICGRYGVLYSTIEDECVNSELENLKIHNRISLNAMNSGTVLPFRFGTMVKSRDNIEELLCNMIIKLDGLFMCLKGKIEVGIKVFGGMEQENLPGDDRMPAIDRLKAVKCMSEPVHYLIDKVKNAYGVRDRVEFLSRLADTLFLVFEPLVCDKCIIYGKKDGLLINGAFLICRDSFQHFKNQFIDIKKQYPHYSLIFSGPWPPYSFVNIGKEGECCG